jgi:hypothetical protein
LIQSGHPFFQRFGAPPGLVHVRTARDALFVENYFGWLKE